MTLSLAALGPALLSEKDSDENTLPPLHLIVPVDLRKGSGAEGYYPYSVLVYLGATYTFISQAVADRLGLEAVRAGRKKKQKKLLLPITTVNGESLCATAIVRQMVRMRDSAGTKRSHAINFVVADIAHYDLILGMAWLQKHHPDIQWDTGVWHWRTRTNAEDGLIRLVLAGAFVATIRAECT